MKACLVLFAVNLALAGVSLEQGTEPKPSAPAPSPPPSNGVVAKSTRCLAAMLPVMLFPFDLRVAPRAERRPDAPH